jgi:hypothetical protein
MSNIDDDRAGSYTLLYYPMREWQQNWAGETVFYGADGEVTHCVTPKPRRAVMFDARVPHAGLALNGDYNGLPKTIGQTVEGLAEHEIHEVALQRLKGGIAILAHAQSL